MNTVLTSIKVKVSKFYAGYVEMATRVSERVTQGFIKAVLVTRSKSEKVLNCGFTREELKSDRGDVPGWVLVVLMTTGLVTAIWTIAAPKLTTILRNSLDSMNGIR